MDQIVQMVGALLVLSSFVLVQLGRLEPKALSYLIANFVGATILAVLAAISNNWGFLLLESVWALVSFWGLARHASLRGEHLRLGPLELDENSNTDRSRSQDP